MMTEPKDNRVGWWKHRGDRPREDRIQRRESLAAGRLRRHAFHRRRATLSRLSRQGVIHRLGKGLYYRPRQTAFERQFGVS